MFVEQNKKLPERRNEKCPLSHINYGLGHRPKIFHATDNKSNVIFYVLANREQKTEIE